MKKQILILLTVSILTMTTFVSCNAALHTSELSSSSRGTSSTQSENGNDITISSEHITVEDIDAAEILQLPSGEVIVRDTADGGRLLKFDGNSDKFSVICDIPENYISLNLISEGKISLYNSQNTSDMIAVDLSNGEKTALEDNSTQYKGNVFIKKGESFTVGENSGSKVYVYPKAFGDYGVLTEETSSVIYTGKYLIAQYNTGEIMPATEEDETAVYYLIAHDYAKNETNLLMQSSDILTFSLFDDSKIIVTKGTDNQTFLFSVANGEKEDLKAINFKDLLSEAFQIKDGNLYYVSNEITEETVTGKIIKRNISTGKEEIVYSVAGNVFDIFITNNECILASIGDDISKTTQKLIMREANGDETILAESVDQFFVVSNKVIVESESSLLVVSI